MPYHSSGHLKKVDYGPGFNESRIRDRTSKNMPSLLWTLSYARPILVYVINLPVLDYVLYSTFVCILNNEYYSSSY